MTTLVRTVHPLVETVAKACGGDEGTARVLVEMALYEALCDHVDQLRPELEVAVSKAIRATAARGLQALAKRDITPQTAQAAEHLYALVQVGKAGDDPRTPFWDARGEGGKFVSGSGSRGLANGLGLLTEDRGDDKLASGTRDALSGLTGQNATAYSRARVIGNGLTAINTPETRALGTLARVVGEIGPEAQAALEPGLRRAAYRYRGTERRPDVAMQRTASLIGQFAEEGVEGLTEGQQTALIRFQQELSAGSDGDTMRAAGMRGAGRREVLSEAAAALATAQAARESGLSPDQARMDAVGTYAVLKLRKQVPDLKVAELSLASGKMPPSLGLLMDSEGRVVSEAMGFNGDHYLPFDLKNLKALKGGQYVRTRAAGGPTSEDIYTGLLTGARQIEVVSNSGVFKVEFDPDLRGGRRYSDKARQMVDRYAKLVAVIEEGKQEKQGLPAAQLRELKETAIAEATVNGRVDVEAARRFFDDARAQAEATAEFSGVDEDALLEQAKQAADREFQQGLRDSPNKPKVSNRTRLQTQKDVFNRLKAQAYEGRYQKYRADGEGYKAALTALQQEFPYFIRRVEHEPLADYLIDRNQLAPNEALPRAGGRDKGYTPQGGLDPRGANREPLSGRAGTGGTRERATALRGGRPAATVAEPRDGAQEASTGATARTSQAAPAATSPTAGAAPQGQQAKTFDGLKPSKQVEDALFYAVQDTLMVRANIDGVAEPNDGENPEKIKTVGNPMAYLGFWTNETNGFGGKKLFTEHLLTKADPAELDKTIAATKAIRTLQKSFPDDPVVGEDAIAPEQFEQTIALLSQLKMLKKPFADPGGADDLSMANVDPRRDRNPQPFADVVKAGPNEDALKMLLRDRDLAAQYADIEGIPDDEVADRISEALSKITNDPATQSAVARGGGSASPVVKQLVAQQKAWAVKRAMELAKLAGGGAPPPFPGAPAAGAEDPGVRKGLGRRRSLTVLSASSPVAKAYASRSARR